jgi:hypothetical protein
VHWELNYHHHGVLTDWKEKSRWSLKAERRLVFEMLLLVRPDKWLHNQEWKEKKWGFSWGNTEKNHLK